MLEGETDAHTLQLTMPPIILVGSITAGTLYDALQRASRLARRVQTFIERLRTKAFLTFLIREGDADGKNLRLSAFEWMELTKQELERRALQSFAWCALHQNNITTRACIKATDTKLVDGVFSYSKLVQMGNCWTRSILSVEPVVRCETLTILYMRPPKEATDMVEVLLRFMVPPPRRRKRQPVSDRRLQIDMDMRTEFKRMVNGHPMMQTLVSAYYLQQRNNIIYTYCEAAKQTHVYIYI